MRRAGRRVVAGWPGIEGRGEREVNGDRGEEVREGGEWG